MIMTLMCPPPLHWRDGMADFTVFLNVILGHGSAVMCY